MRSTILFFILLLAHLSSAQAESSKVSELWSEGFHLLAGGGLAGSVYEVPTEGVIGALGANFKTDLGYTLYDRLSIEWSSNVTFQSLESRLVWSSYFALGPRVRLNRFSSILGQNPYIHLNIGLSPNVIYVDDRSSRSKGVDRIQLDGPRFGASFGSLYTDKEDRTWFSEVTFTYQLLREADSIGNKGSVPVIRIRERLDDESRVFGLYLNVGVMVY